MQSPIRGRGETVEQLFTGQRYRLGDYQREYSWSQEAVRALLNDLHSRFMSSWREGHSRAETQTYEPYFLGAYVFHEEDGRLYLVDGQQRFTTLHLLLIYLRHLLLDQENQEDADHLIPLIQASRRGRRTYTLDIEERADLLTALFDGGQYAPRPQASPSIRAMLDRYQDIDEFFPEELRDERLPLFCDWLLDRVCLVGIQATGRDNGWEIFESMNNRGVPLGPIDLLKSHLLYSADRSQRSSLNREWRQMLSTLNEHESDQPNAASRFVKTLLIAKYADLGEGADDREQIEKSFHEWVRSHERDRMGLNRAEDFEKLIKMFGTYAEHYKMLVRASYQYETGGQQLQSLYFNRHNGLEFQLPLIFATLRDNDTQSTVKSKAELVGTFLDCVHVRRIVNNETSVNKMEFEVKRLIPELRGTRTVAEVRDFLGAIVNELAPDLTAIQSMILRQNHRQVKYVLGRLTAFVQDGCGGGDRCDEYLDRENYQIEHIWSRGSKHRNIENFELLRNLLCLLVLLPGSDNASYRDDPYEKKVEHYYRQNWLAASLHPKAYTRNPDFRSFRRKQGLSDAFRAFPQEIAPGDLEARQGLYLRLAEKVWNLDFLGPAVAPRAVVAAPTERSAQSRRRYGISVGDLIVAKVLSEGEQLRGTRRNEEFWMTVLGDGRLRTSDGRVHGSPSGAGQLVLGSKACDGWRFWHVQRSGKWRPLRAVRQDAIDRGFLEKPSG